jgi:carbamoyl-phosphate synthase large subunit
MHTTTQAAPTLDSLTSEKLLKAKQLGFSDRQLAAIFGVTEDDVREHRKTLGVMAVYKTIDTCAAEFEAATPYHYSTYEFENESISSSRKKVVILGGGPNRIGQGIEFDYCCVQSVFALRKAGYETIMINCNPETVSTDYDTTDKLYFEPLTFEDVMNIIEHEKPLGVIVSFGGQTPLKLSTRLAKAGVKILGTSSEGIDVAEDRKKFGKLLDDLKIPHPDYGTASTYDEARTIANRIGYPVLVRPSYVLGGRAMQVIYNDEILADYIKRALRISERYPILIDKFLENATEFDIDALADCDPMKKRKGTVVVSGIMQHIEAAGIHSGDSTSVLPPYNATKKAISMMKKYTRTLADSLGVIGLMNIQFALQNDVVYVLEVNPRASRSVPFVCKATGVPIVQIASLVMLGKSLVDLKKKYRLADCDDIKLEHISIKEPVFPFSKFLKSGVYLGPEMRSTGEVMSLASTFGEAFAKSAQAAGNKLPVSGTVFISVSNADKNERTLAVAGELYRMGFDLLASAGTAKFLREHDTECKTVFKVGEGKPNIFDIIRLGKVQFVINTPLGEKSRYDEEAIGTAAILSGVPFVTTVSAAEAAVMGIQKLRTENFSVCSLQEHLKKHRRKI